MSTQSSLPALLLAAVVGGLSAALTLTLVGDGSPRRGAQGAPTPSAGEGPLAPELQRRLAQLEELGDEFQLRLATLEATPRGAAESLRARTPQPGDEPQTAQLAEAQGLEAMQRTFSSNDPVPEIFVSRVQEALGEIRAGEEREREVLREQARDERVEERLASLSSELGLSSYQVDEMRLILTEQEDRRAELFSSMRDEGGPPPRSEMIELFESTDEALRGVLSEEQYSSYRESNGGGRFGPPGGPGRGDRGESGDGQAGGAGGFGGGRRGGGQRRGG